MSEEDTGGISVDYDTLVDQISARNSEDSERAQSAGESRAAIKEFLEETGLHSKVFSFGRALMKQKKVAVQLDMLRSLDEMIPLLRAWIDGNHGQRDMLDEVGDEKVPLDDENGNVTPFDPEAA